MQAKKSEAEFKGFIDRLFDKVLEKNIQKYGIEKVGLHLGEILKGMDGEVVSKVVPRAIEKHTNGKVKNALLRLSRNEPDFIPQIRKVGVSVANSLRPIAGNRFTLMVARVLKPQLNALGLECVTSGSIKSRLNKALVVKGDDGEVNLKPDIDIIVYKAGTSPEKVLAILSCKTTLAERLMQTVRWRESLNGLPKEYQGIKVFLVTAWETFENPTQRSRARQLDGAYCCSENISEDSKIKRFDRLVGDLKRLA